MLVSKSLSKTATHASCSIHHHSSNRRFIEHLACNTRDLVMTLCKRLAYLLPSHRGRRHHLLFSTSSTDPHNPPPQTPFIISYLINSCGFTPETASKASRYVAHIKSPSKPDTVVNFLKQSGGLSDAHIRTVLSKHPGLLRADVETTLKPKLQDLQQLGLSDENLHRLIVLCPRSLSSRDVRPKIEFWRDFYSDNVDNFFKVIKRDNNLLTTRFDTRIEPSLALLRSYGLSDAEIARMILRAPRLITKKVDIIEALVRRAEELGVPRSSGMFHYALGIVHSFSEAKIDSKVELLRRMGCSADDIKFAVQKCPSLLGLSEKKMRDCMEFLTEKAGCEPSYVIRHPVLLKCSLERKLIPRNQVLQTLWSKKLVGSGSSFYTAMIITEKKFLEKYVLPYKEMAPGLYENYIAAYVGKVGVGSND